MTQNKEVSIAEKNEVIAIFEGRKRALVNQKGRSHIFWSDPTGTNPLYSEELYYHLSWDELMPVVEKIEKEARVDIYGPACKISKAEWTEDIAYVNESKITAVYLAVYQFITWYNTTLK